jgi:hypothetical protein
LGAGLIYAFFHTWLHSLSLQKSVHDLLTQAMQDTIVFMKANAPRIHQAIIAQLVTGVASRTKLTAVLIEVTHTQGVKAEGKASSFCQAPNVDLNTFLIH